MSAFPTMRLVAGGCQQRMAVASTSSSSCCSSSSTTPFTARSSRRVSSPSPHDFGLARSRQHEARPGASRGSNLRTNALHEAAAMVVESSSAAASLMATTTATTTAEFASSSSSALSASNAVFELASSMFKIPGAVSISMRTGTTIRLATELEIVSNLVRSPISCSRLVLPRRR